MHILMIIDGLPGGGAEKVVLTLCQGMQQLGHEVCLISLRNVCHYPLPVDIRYQIVEDDCRAPWRKRTELTRRAAQLDNIIIKEERRYGAFDLVFSHLHKTDRIVSHCRAIAPERLWFCIHGILSASYLGHRNKLSAWLKKKKIAKIYQAKKVVAVSQAVANDIQHTLAIKPERLAVINNPFDISDILKKAAQPCELPAANYLLHVGRFHPHKRHDRLLQAYALSGIQAPLVLIGTGSETMITQVKQQAQQLGIGERVKFLGFQKNPYPFIRHAALLILSSDSEGFGNVLVEALLCGTPIVSTNCPGGPEEIAHKAGIPQVLAQLDASSLAEKIALIYHNPPAINYSQLEEYSLVTICQHYLQLNND